VEDASGVVVLSTEEPVLPQPARSPRTMVRARSRDKLFFIRILLSKMPGSR
jgi:hypothetical protein